MATRTYLEAISDALRDAMRRDERVFLIGEDIGHFGGAFKVTEGFLQEFGEWRVLDTPLSETAIIGACTGAALVGMRPVAEMQFADFVSCAWDQLVGRGLLRRPLPLSESRVELCAHPGPEDRVPLDPDRREGPAHDGDRGSEPGPLLRAQAPVPPPQGGRARRALHDPVRQGADPP